MYRARDFFDELGTNFAIFVAHREIGECLANAVCSLDSDTVTNAASASVVGMVDRFPMMLSFEDASVGRPRRAHTGFRCGRLTSSNVATWVLSTQDSSVAPQTLQDA
jgi:hypothetical protein